MAGGFVSKNNIIFKQKSGRTVLLRTRRDRSKGLTPPKQFEDGLFAGQTDVLEGALFISAGIAHAKHVTAYSALELSRVSVCKPCVAIRAAELDHRVSFLLAHSANVRFNLACIYLNQPALSSLAYLAFSRVA